VGLFVFVIWVAPDLLFHYRHHWLFENSITGHAARSLPPSLGGHGLFLAVRVLLERCPGTGARGDFLARLVDALVD
jgi:hypothetical protein